MLALRPVCENCNKLLPYNSTEAMICSFECTFCSTCVNELLKNVCPNCGGGFTPRPIRPKKSLEKNPPKSEPLFRPVDMEKHAQLLKELQHIDPANR